MNRSPLLPALVLAAGVLVGTLLAKLAGGSAELTMLGPIVLAVALLVAARLRTGGAPNRGLMLDAAILAASILVAGAMLAAKDPNSVAGFLPILGGAAAVPVLVLRRRTCRPSCS